MKSKSRNPKYYLILVKVVSFSIFLGSTISCSNEPLYNDSLIRVDSITIEYIPSLVYPNDLFSINLYGTISSNGCSSFDGCKFYIQNQDLIIEAWKKTEVNQGICPAVMVYLNQSLIFNKKDLPEYFIIKIKQPDGSFLIRPMI